MIITDRVYGKIEVKNKIIEDLILSKPLQRLKKISQDGASHFIQPLRKVNRFEHSIGVWYLSYIFERPIEEQIACLLHDVPHTAFSHVIDFVFPNERHDFHEKFTEKIIMNSEIPSILGKHNIELIKVLDTNRFQLLENDLPDISFDRWDYFMRDGLMMNFLPKVLINEFVNNIFLKNNKLYFKDIKLASTYAILFASFSRLIWLDPTSHGSYFLLSSVLKMAISKNIISEDDFFTDDIYLISKIEKSNDKDIKKLLDKLKPNHEFIYSNEDDSDFIGPNKPRSVDPWVDDGSKLVKLSSKVYSLGYYFEEFKERYKNIGVKQIH